MERKGVARLVETETTKHATATMRSKIEAGKARRPARNSSARNAPNVQSNQSMVGNVQTVPEKSWLQSVKKSAAMIRVRRLRTSVAAARRASSSVGASAKEWIEQIKLHSLATPEGPIDRKKSRPD
jgi:hypothetical protein